ncbi:MAG TPA: sugar ABC transporter permease, partial [Clostridiales bacterium]|nr:sugar ABC transporter permease [Clostridiales bacterium]
MKQKTRKTLMLIGRVLILTFFLLAVILPIYWMVITSLKTAPEIINAQSITYFPKVTTMENYASLFEMYNYGQLLENSLIVSITSGICVTLLSILGGYGMARYDFHGKNSLVLLALVTQMIPSILVIIPLYIIFSQIGLINTRFGLFLFYLMSNLPFCVITMRSFFERFPHSLEEAARIDGCTKVQS